MGTAGGEPRVLLNALKPMLGVVGDIKTPQEVMRVVGMMKDAEKLMSRCIYLNILKATCRQAIKNEEKKETLHKFLATGGWGILNKWLMEFMKSENFPVLLELIDVLKVLPITVELLKQGNTGKIMKSMTKLENTDVKKSAAGLIKQWKTMIRVKEVKMKPANENEVKDEENQKTDSSDPSDSNGSTNALKTDSPVGVKGEQDEKTKRKLSLDPSKALDSSGFMNALMISPSPVKKKRRTSNDTNPKKATMPLDELLKDTAVQKPEEGEKVEVPGSPERQQEEEPSVFVYHSPAVEAANALLAQDTIDTVIIDEGSIARKKNKTKRNITWAAEDKLVQISYFELQEGEKKGSHAENFSQARHLELMLEKQAMRAARRGEDRMAEKVEWRCLIPVDNAGVPGFIPGEKSKQRFIQAEREKSVLAYIFLSKKSLPDCPAEPDFNPDEHNRTHQATIIPHDEEQTVLPPHKGTTQKSTQQSTLNTSPTTIQSSSNSQTSQPPVQNKSGTPNLVSSAVQNIMSHLQQQMSNNNTSNTSPTLPPPNPLPHMVVPPPILGQPGLVPGQPGLVPPFPIFPNNPNIPPPNMNPNIPPPNLPPPNIPPPNLPPPIMNQQSVNNNNNFNPQPPVEQTMGLMDAPNMIGRGIRGGGPRFMGGRGFNNNGGGDGGFNVPGGPAPRGRWSGPPNQGRNSEWDDNNYNNDNSNFRGRGRGQNNLGGHRGEHRGGRGGFRRGGDNFHRGRGGNNNRGRGNNDRGRGNNDRGKGNNDHRGRYSGEWGYDDNRNNHRNRKDGEWNRDARNYGNDSSRGERDHSGGHRDHSSRDNTRSRDDRSKGNKR